ncbi:hypothetical protein MD588_11625 [Photobacterium sp. SDRW27]|uniref:hypothetical protein n=1 Tax=Photobacterium obscurum TaxID=2829490 RepID=UPI002242C74E|nr:hypothetical protein [Photobacterium obscurum]MCW8329458.1 hypothetical protein [Photobacterium obscurum]
MYFSSLSIALKLAVTGFLLTLLLGCLSVATLIGLIYSDAHSGFHLPDIEKVASRYGESRLVGAMKTSMYDYVTADEDIATVERWVKQGALNDELFQKEVMTILRYDCESCHSRTSTKTDAINSMPLSGYDDVLQHTQQGYSWSEMAKAAHIHLYGIALLLFVVTLALAKSSCATMLKYGLITVGWLALWVDIASWWLAKYSIVFAYTLAAAGAIEIMILSFSSVLILVEMWWKLPDWIIKVKQR